jgi:hypothetical protein
MGIAYGITTLHQATKGIVQDGLVLNLDPAVKDSYDTGTTWRDLRGNNNATLENQASLIKDNGGCFTLDGTDDYIRILNVSNIASNSISHSYCIWVRIRGDGGNIISASNANPQGNWNMPPIRAGSNFLSGRFWALNNLIQSGYSLNTWYYLSLVWNYSATDSERGQTFYVNGSLVGSQFNVTASLSPSHLFIGQANPGADNQGNLNGDIGPLHLYTYKALSAAEVLQNFNATRHRFGI